MRCLTLAKAARSRGAAISFACKSLPFELCSKLADLQINLIEIPPGTTELQDAEYCLANPGIATISASAVPVPAAAWLFGSALAGFGFLRRRVNAP